MADNLPAGFEETKPQGDIPAGFEEVPASEVVGSVMAPPATKGAAAEQVVRQTPPSVESTLKTALPVAASIGLPMAGAAFGGGLGVGLEASPLVTSGMRLLGAAAGTLGAEQVTKGPHMPIHGDLHDVAWNLGFMAPEEAATSGLLSKFGKYYDLQPLFEGREATTGRIKAEGKLQELLKDQVNPETGKPYTAVEIRNIATELPQMKAAGERYRNAYKGILEDQRSRFNSQYSAILKNYKDVPVDSSVAVDQGTTLLQNYAQAQRTVSPKTQKILEDTMNMLRQRNNVEEVKNIESTLGKAIDGATGNDRAILSEFEDSVRSARNSAIKETGDPADIARLDAIDSRYADFKHTTDVFSDVKNERFAPDVARELFKAGKSDDASYLTSLIDMAQAADKNNPRVMPALREAFMVHFMDTARAAGAGSASGSLEMLKSARTLRNTFQAKTPTVLKALFGGTALADESKFVKIIGNISDPHVDEVLQGTLGKAIARGGGNMSWVLRILAASAGAYAGAKIGGEQFKGSPYGALFRGGAIGLGAGLGFMGLPLLTKSIVAGGVAVNKAASNFLLNPESVEAARNYLETATLALTKSPLFADHAFNSSVQPESKSAPVSAASPTQPRTPVERPKPAATKRLVRKGRNSAQPQTASSAVPSL